MLRILNYLFLALCFSNVACKDVISSVEFQFECGTKLRTSLEIIENLIAQKERTVELVAPCKHCILTKIAFDTFRWDNISAELAENDIDVITTSAYDLKHYSLACDCQMNPSFEEVAESVKTLKHLNSNKSCSKIVYNTEAPKMFDPEMVLNMTSCIPKLKDDEAKEPVTLSIEGGNISLIFSVQNTTVLNNGKHKSSAKLVSITVVVNALPKVKCKGSDSAFTAAACKCFLGHGFFAVYEFIVPHLLFRCKNETTENDIDSDLNSVMNSNAGLLSCPGIYWDNREIENNDD